MSFSAARPVRLRSSMALSRPPSVSACVFGWSDLQSGRPVILRPYGPRSAMRNSSMSCAGICAFPATSRSETTMFNLKEYRSSNTRLADFLPWAALVGDGVVLNKDGSLQRSVRFRGPDLDSAVPAELVAVASRLNNAFRLLGPRCAIFVEPHLHHAPTNPATTYPSPPPPPPP